MLFVRYGLSVNKHSSNRHVPRTNVSFIKLWRTLYKLPHLASNVLHQKRWRHYYYKQQDQAEFATCHEPIKQDDNEWVARNFNINAFYTFHLTRQELSSQWNNTTNAKVFPIEEHSGRSPICFQEASEKFWLVQYVLDWRYIQIPLNFPLSPLRGYRTPCCFELLLFYQGHKWRHGKHYWLGPKSPAHLRDVSNVFAKLAKKRVRNRSIVVMKLQWFELLII